MKMNHIALTVSENLNLKMFCPTHIAFQENSWVTKSSFSFSLSLLQHGLEVFFIYNHTHAPATSAKSSFNDQRKSDLPTPLKGFSRLGYRIGSSGQSRNTSLVSGFLRCNFIPHPLNQFRARTDKGYASLITGLGKGWVFGKKPIPRVNHVHTLFFRQSDDGIDIEISSYRTFTLPHQVGFICFEAMHAKAVFFGINGNGS